jgi:quercetin dioxygenase-like cupin family protein
MKKKSLSKSPASNLMSGEKAIKLTNPHTDVVELPKSKEHIIVEIVEYVSNAVISRTIIKKITGNVTAMSFSEGEELSEKTIPFDTYIQIIDGAADLTIAKKLYHLILGSGIIIPAHALHHFNATQKFKMISTIIKSGYED